MQHDPLHPIQAAQRQRSLMLRVVRMAFFILILTVALLNAAQATAPLDLSIWVVLAGAIILFSLGVGVDILTPNKKVSSISGVFLGILAGLVAALAMSLVVDLLLTSWITEEKVLKTLTPFVDVFKVMLGITLCYLGVSTVLQTQDDFRLVIPYVEFAKQIRGVKPLILDTSALIDARIADVSATGLVQAPLVIPRFVIAELQLLADSSDKMKRARGRRGLEVVSKLQRLGKIDVTIDETPITAMAVDQMLVELANRMMARIVTTDLGLTRVAQIHGITVLNLHEIANAFKPALIPGEQISLRLVKPGEQAGQAVGYLDDGTMVVAEQAAHRIGEDSLLLVTSTLQTSAGRIIFTKLLEIAGEGRGESRDRPTEPVASIGTPPAGPSLPAAPQVEEHDVSGNGAETSEAEQKAGPIGPRMFGRRGPSPRNPRR